MMLAACGSSKPLNFGTDGSAAFDPATREAIEKVAASSIEEHMESKLGVDVTIDTTTNTDTNTVSTDAVLTSFTALLDSWTSCFHRPARCDVESLTVPESPERARLRESLAYYTTEQIRTLPDEGRLEWGIESITLPTDDRARLTTCEYDTRIFFDSSMADTELGDIIFDTTIWTRRVEWTMSRVDDEWRLFSRRIDRRSPVARFCQP